MNKRNILIADDHKLVRECISYLLASEANICIAGSVHSGLELVRFLEQNQNVHIVLLDIEMPDMNGIDAAKIIRRKYPKIKIIMLSMHVRKSFVKHLMNIGVDAYIHKDTSSENLLLTIERVMNDEIYYDPRVVETILDIQREHHQGNTLSEREIEVLKLIAKEHTNKEISKLLNLAPATIDFHRRNIYEKTGLKNTAGLTKYAIREGIIKTDG